MIIITQQDKIKFSELGEGDVLLFEGHYYIKIYDSTVDNLIRNAVNLYEGELVTFSSDNMVVPINGRFVLERN